VSEFRSFNNGTSKGVLDLLETTYLRLDKTKTKTKTKTSIIFKTKTRQNFLSKTKIKTLLFVLEAPRDQDFGLQDYIAGYVISSVI